MSIRNLGGRKAVARRLLSSASVAVLALAGALALPSVASANDWTGAASDDWFTAGNWSNLNAVPTVNANADINTVAVHNTVINTAGAIANDVTVGATGNGQLLINNGGTLDNYLSYIGRAAGSNGTVNVSGAGSTWNSATLFVGREGAGSLGVYTGGKVVDITAYLGFDVGSTGYAQIDGVGATWIHTSDVIVGDLGEGVLNIRNGGFVGAGGTTVARGGGSVGTLFLDGVGGSTLTNSVSLIVGGAGAGEMTINNGGKAKDVVGVVGDGLGGTGAVKVDGAGSSWVNTGALTVGNLGDGTVSVTDGGLLENGQGFIANQAGHSGGLSIDGAGSYWLNHNAMAIGYRGAGTLSISDGGRVDAPTGVLAYYAGSTGAATITGSDSIWNSSANLLLGSAGAGTLTVSDRGIAKAGGSIIIGQAVGSSGTLNIGAASGSAAQAAGTLDTGSVIFGAGTGLLNFNHTETTYVFAPQLGGAGTINQLAGITTLSANSSGFTGTTNVNGGRLLVNGTLGGTTSVLAGGALGGSGMLTGPVSIASSGRLLGQTGQTLTMSSLVLDSGAAVNVTLGAPGAASLFNVAGALTLDGTLNVVDAGAFGTGVYRLFNYGGALTDNGLDIGALPVGNNGVVQTSVAAQVNLVVNGAIVPGGPPAIQFWNGTTTVANGTINGGDGVWTAGPQTNWTDATGTQVDAWGGLFAVFQSTVGAVTVDDAAGDVLTTGMQFIGQGWTVNGAQIVLNGAGGETTVRVGDGTVAGATDSATIGSALTGASRLVKDDLGTLILTAGNSYSGGTSIAAGTLVGRAGSFGTGAITDNGTLVVDQATSAGFTNLLGGTGLFVKKGAGTLTMNTVNSFSGATTISAGQLTVNGSLTNSAVTVQSGGILAGAGTVGGLAVQSGGTVNPGISTGDKGSLQVTGAFSQAAGSTYALDLTSTGSTDRIYVTGAATIAGGAVLKITKTNAAPYVLGTRYTVLEAQGGVSGDYTLSGTTQLSTFISLVDTYDAKHVYLDVAQTKTFAAAGVTPNQIAAATGADSLPTANPLATAVVWLPTDAAARDAFDQISGDIHASIEGALLDDSRFVRDATLDRLRDVFAGGAVADDTGVWGRTFGSWGETDSDGNAAGLDRDIGGVLMGADGRLFSTVRFGVFGGYSHARYDVADRNASGTSDSYHLGLYAGTQRGALALRSGAAYAWHDLSTDRSVAFAGFSGALDGGYRAATAQAFGEIAYRIPAGEALSFEPFAGIAWVSLANRAFSERGGAAALTRQEDSADVAFTTLGVRVASRFTLAGGATLAARGTLGWRHAEGDTTPVSTLSFEGGSTFAVAGAPIAADTAAVEAGLDMAFSPTASVGMSYSGQFGDGASDQSVRASFTVRF